MYDRDREISSSDEIPWRTFSPGREAVSRASESPSLALRRDHACSVASSLLSIGEERSLGWRILNEHCIESAERLRTAHLPLVHSIADRYCNRGPSKDELRARGEMGLLRAIETFDPAQGMRFSTHASWWIKHFVRVSLQTAGASSSISTPAS